MGLIQEYDGLAALPKTLHIYGASDYATMDVRKGKREPDFTEHGVWGMDHIGDLWAIDWWSGQKETDVGIAQFIKLVRMWRPLRWWNEGGVIDKAIGPAIRRAMREAETYVAVEALPSLSDKSVKLQAFHARATAGTIHVPIRKKWAEDLIEQLVKFPAGRWDDKADVCGLIGRGIDQMTSASIPLVARRPTLVPFSAAWLEYDDKSKTPDVRYF